MAIKELAAGQNSYVLSVYGVVYKLSKSSYKKWLQVAASGKNWTLEDFGTYIGVHENVTDITPQEAQERLDKLR